MQTLIRKRITSCYNRWLALVSLIAFTPNVVAQSGATGDDDIPIFYHPLITITATRVEKSSFAVPASIDVVEKAIIQSGQPQINLSESLSRVPGIVAKNRQNYAQDLQISSRGFGARAAFGVRGVRLLSDGIPATMPDGQGQPGIFSLSSTRRIEVLRGPFSALYGNSSGGVIQLFSEDGPPRPTLSVELGAGSYQTTKADIKLAGQADATNYLFDLSRFRTEGFRQHSAAGRDQFNSKLRYSIDQDSNLTFVANTLAQPNTQDPLGLTRAEVMHDAQQANTLAASFNTRKDVDHRQMGLIYDNRLNANDNIRVLGYLGERQLVQYLAFSGAGATSSGGVVDLDRAFGGWDVRWTRKSNFANRPFTVTGGISYDDMREHRSGFVNENGNAGALRRDEQDKVFNFDQYLQTEWQFANQWILTAGLRRSVVKFDSRDRYIVGVNPDDSGSAAYHSTNPVAGVLYQAIPGINFYATAGKGFETPTFAELAYRPDSAPGLNFDLHPSKSRNIELGIKAKLSSKTNLNLAVFSTATRDEIVTAASVAGRTTYRNAGRTKRYGIELALKHDLNRSLSAYVASTYLDASFKGDSLDGNRLPGVPQFSLFSELIWRHRPSGLILGLESHANSKVYVNDANSETAAGYVIVNWHAGFTQKKGLWQFNEFLRVDNLFNKNYIGSVIVGEANGRFYEPASKRNYFLGMSMSRGF